MMETIESFSEFLRKIGTLNFLAIGAMAIVIWLLVSGFQKGLKRGKPDKSPEETGDQDREE